MRLTDVSVRTLPAPEKGQKDYRDDTMPGLMCRVSQGGTKSFVLVHGLDRRRVTLGRYPIISLADARAEAKRILAEHTLGKRQVPRQTFKEALDAFLAYHEANNRPGTTSEVRRILTKQYVSLHRHQLSDVTTHQLTRITDRMVNDGHPSAANHAHMAVRNFLRWCVRRRLLQHSPLDSLEKPAATPSRERVLNDDELLAIWDAAEKVGGQYGIIIKLLLLTGQRRGEIASLQAGWLDIENKTCTLPSSITKNKRRHTFPIGELSVSILSTTSTRSGIVFPARNSSTTSFNGWSKAKAQLDKLVGIHWRDINQNANQFTPWTLHDLRRTYATNLQRLGIRIEVIEALLNHVSGTRAGIVGVYQKHRYETEMRDAVATFEQWFQRDIIRT